MNKKVIICESINTYRNRKTDKISIFQACLMPLQKIQFKPGFNKQQTATGAEGQWIDGDFVRFRYGEPEKVGGFQQLVLNLAGPARDQHTWTALDGKKYAAIRHSKLLIIYYEGQFFDITPLDTALTSCTYTSTTQFSNCYN
jgi:hypothetical protein